MLKPLLGIAAALALGTLVAWAGSQGGLAVRLNGASLPLFALCAALAFILHWLLFIPAYAFQTERYFDLTGSASYIAAVALALSCQPQPDLRSLLIAALIAVWALRLGRFLFARVIRQGGDGRFAALKPRFTRFLFVWTLSAAWVLVTLAPGLAAVATPPAADVALPWLLYAGLALWATGFTLEVVADHQKTRFNRNPANKGRFIQSGLWRLSRHPNYLGEILLWTGIAIMAAPALAGWQLLTLASPLCVAILLTRISGVNLLERRSDAKWGQDPAYQCYKAQTPALLPRLRSADSSH